MKVVREHKVETISMDEVKKIGKWSLQNNYIIVVRYNIGCYKLHKTPCTEEYAFLNVDSGYSFYGPTGSSVIDAINKAIEQGGEVHMFKTFKEFSDWVNKGE